VIARTDGVSGAEGQKRRALLAEGKQFRLDDSAGNETIYVVASKESLNQADPALDEALARDRSGNSKPDCGPSLEGSLAGAKVERAKPAPAPRIAKLTTPVPWNVRGLKVVDGDDEAVKASAGSDGIVVLRFRFQHR
jgi:hypothetical protein